MASAGGIDLNLLTVLVALLEQRNVTRAGVKLSLSQPTMSGALSRLRQYFSDELLVRTGRGYELTPLACGLLPAVREALEQVELTLSAPAEFEPATSRRQFSVAVSAHSVLTQNGALRRVRELAPGVRLEIWPLATTRTEASHSVLGYDVLIAPEGFQADGEAEVLLRDRIVYVADPANPWLCDGQLTADALAGLPHAVARLPQADLAARAMEGLGVIPRVVATAAGWLPLPFMVTGTEMVAAVPERLARLLSEAAGVAVFDPPFGNIELAEVAWWHPMHATDPALTWLRGLLTEATSRVAGAAPLASDVPLTSAAPFAVAMP